MANLKPSQAAKIQNTNANIRRIPVSESADGGANWVDKSADFANLRLYSDLLPITSAVLANYNRIAGGEVILSAMNSLDGLEAEGGTEEGTGTGTFDGFRGYLPDVDVAEGGGGVTNLQYNMSSFAADLVLRGQISFYVEYDLITTNNPTGANGPIGLGSTGNTRAQIEYLGALTHTGPTAPTISGEFRKETSNALSIKLNRQDDLNGSIVTTSAGKQRYVNIVISWTAPDISTPGTQTVYIDGIKSHVMAYTPPPDATVNNFFNYLYMGARGNAVDPIENWVKDLTVTSRPASFQILTDSRLAWAGHSFPFDGIESWAGIGSAQISALDQTAMNVLQGEMRNRFSKELDIVTHASGGAVIQRDLNPVGGTYQDLIPAILADNPRFATYLMGANDVVRLLTIDPVVQTDMQLDIIDLIAGGVERVFVFTCTTTKTWVTGGLDDYSKPEYTANTATFNGWVNALPAWWDALPENVGNEGKVIVVDIFNAFGGEEPYANVFNGQITGLNDDLHPSAWGHSIMGRALLDQMIPYL